ncbi:uncharacterized protein K460DRAFT_294550 [Cucurbitaria berberidis CBS 394.84]|uniref:Uncharacterized protein n=1 Tax=Cucurbitaria berberidis CBS 394.84 TaxID=1168544 RepID=A0A9P4L4M3_9PLEO|nr:uncharacterized protein K460DRAFT_294550 [Cucurbitaria berberidis CBS 394.84]KAF1841028.1 hypothetical protein K460DRAFT_294550 [Cucurbitaria berberidis CBS 394.84]
METWMSWAVFLGIAGAAYWYYNQNTGAIARGRSTTRTPTASSLKDAAQWTDSERKPKAAPKPAKPAKAKAPRKTVKTTVQEVANKAEAYLSTASSTADADADDDLSPVASPAIASNKAPSGRDVSDMLGNQAAVPSVLSIKPSEKHSRPAKPQAQKADVSQETKKQRQNKKKVEEAKAAREVEEKQRQALLEQQRRTAREARGESAKNGLQAAKAPTSNAWTAVPSRGAAQGGPVQAPASASTGQLLDTFEAAPTTSSSNAPTNGTTSTSDSYNGLPSEEEQLRLAMEDSAWTTVPKGGKKQRKTINDELLEEGSNFSAVQEHVPAKPVRPTQAMKPENQKPSSRYQILSEPYIAQGNDDSDWPVV